MMKKSVFGLLCFLMTTTSCQKNEHQRQQQKASSTISVTLNGIDENSAFKMMKTFIDLKDNDINPGKTNVWFDSTTVHRMYNLLQAEGADGLRIYFVSDTIAGSTHLKNSIILVSTKANGANPAAPSGMRHLDYYEHSPDNILFRNLRAIKGTVNYPAATSDAALYNTCQTCKVETINQQANMHQISRRTAEQMVQHFGNHPVNTISEWFDIALLKAITSEKSYDGLRIYFATKPAGMQNAGTDAFVIIGTTPGDAADTHIDAFGSGANGGAMQKVFDGGPQDNGEQCPTNCN